MSKPHKAPATRSTGSIKLTPAPIGDVSVVRPALSAQQRHARIALAAYYFAERRGFQAGHELDDWLRAESEIDSAPGVGAPTRT